MMTITLGLDVSFDGDKADAQCKWADKAKASVVTVVLM
tara:strand:+ start:697 stop:810 length:114 start_codon:yes stop_codon:yes gene_type:complete